jgi:hypothetical protein
VANDRMHFLFFIKKSIGLLNVATLTYQARQAKITRDEHRVTRHSAQ